jgi:hypothetical protein
MLPRILQSFIALNIVFYNQIINVLKGRDGPSGPPGLKVC